MELNLDLVSSLLPNLITMLTQLVSTGILFFFMKKLAWEPVRKILNSRSEFEQNKLLEAEKKNAESKEYRIQAEEELQKAGVKAKELIETGSREGQRIKQKLADEAKREYDEAIAEARREITYEKKRAREEMKKEMIDIAIMSAEKLLNEKLDENKDRQLVESFVKELSFK